MANRKTEKLVDTMEEVSPVIDSHTREMYEENRKEIYKEERPTLKNCLRNQTVRVSFISKSTPLVQSKNHVLYGGKAQTSYIHLCVPLLKNGQYINVLTNDEKEYLEYIMGLPHNALSVFRKVDNYWDNYYIRLTPEGIRLNLNNPEDYIKYKVLLANKSKVCPSRLEYERNPKAEYEFIVEDEHESTNMAVSRTTAVMEAYSLLQKNFNDIDTLRTILETITLANIDKNTSIGFIQSKLDSIIQNDVKRFIEVAKDEYLIYKVLVRNAYRYGLLINKGGFYYLKSNGAPLANKGEEPNITNASVFLSLPENAELKFTLEAEINRINKINDSSRI